MTSKKTLRKALPAYAGAIICACILLGCEKKETAIVPPNAPESYMNDPVFMGKIKAQDAMRRDILKRHTQALKAYRAAKDKGAPAAEVEALKAKAAAIEEEFQKQRAAVQALVRDRLRDKGKKQ